MQNQSSSFERFSSLRIKYFVGAQTDSENTHTTVKDQKISKTLKMSKSSEALFFKKNIGVAKKQTIDKSMTSINESRRGEIEALFNDSCGGQYEEIKSLKGQKSKYLTTIKGRKEITPEQVGKQFALKKKGSLNRKPFSQKQMSEKEKAQSKKGDSEQLTEPFTPYDSSNTIQEQLSKQLFCKAKSIKQCNFNKTKSNEKQPIKTKISIQNFKMLKKIGKGVEGQVHLAAHKTTGMIFAIKIIYKDYLKNEKNQENFFREIKIHLHINDKNVIKLYNVFSDKDNIYLLLEPMIEGDLFNIVRKHHHLSEKNVSKIILNVCKGVRALHEKEIFHRDLKLQNILLTQGIAKIGDLGCAVHSYCMRKSAIGSPNYLSPQQMGFHYYNKKIDIWSIGVITFELLFGESPFAQQIKNALLNHQQLPHFNLIFPSNIKVSEDAVDFIKKCLQKNPNTRMDIQTALNHPFIRIRTTTESPI